MATIKDVALAAGVSTATVSYVLNNSVPVSEPTRERVLRAATALGYRPNQRARNLQQRRTGTLGLVLEERQADGWRMTPGLEPGDFLPACVEQAALAGYQLLLLVPTARHPVASLVNDTLLDGHVDGLVILYSGPSALAPAAPHIWAGWPPRSSSAPAVICDGAAGGRRAIEALAHQGCQQIGLITPAVGTRGAARWYLGYRRGLKDAGLAFNPGAVIEPQGNAAADGSAAMDALLASGIALDGVLVAGGELAYGTTQSAVRSGRHPGPDLRIISGYDGPLVAGADLTALRWPLDLLAHSLITQLLAGLAGYAVAQRTILTPTLVVRTS